MQILEDSQWTIYNGSEAKIKGCERGQKEGEDEN